MNVKYWWIEEFNGGKKSAYFDNPDKARQDMWKEIRTIEPTKDTIGKTVSLIKGSFSNGQIKKLEKINIIFLTGGSNETKD